MNNDCRGAVTKILSKHNKAGMYPELYFDHLTSDEQSLLVSSLKLKELRTIRIMLQVFFWSAIVGAILVVWPLLVSSPIN